MRLLQLITFPNWAGESSDHRSAVRQGDRKRRRFLQALQRQARGLGEFDEVDGLDVLRNADDVAQWFRAHGIDAAA